MRARPRTLLLTAATAGGLLAAGVLVGVSLVDPVADPVVEPLAEPAEGSAGLTRQVAWQGSALSPAASCEDLLAWHVDRAEELVTPWGWGGYAGRPVAAADLTSKAQASVGGALRSAASDSATTSAYAGDGMTNAVQSGTGTNVQEAGVDEPDVAKSDGRLLVRVEPGGWGGGLVVADVTGAAVRETARLDLPDVVDPELLLGVGEGPVPTRRGGESWGAQAGLFDLADLAEPRRLDVESWAPGTRHVAATDPRAFTWLPGSRTALSVITRGWGARTGWVSVVRLRDGVISQELVEVEHGSDVERVRLVRLPDTRVLLVTGDDASFFPV